MPIIQGFSNSVKGWGKPLPYNKKIPSKFSIPPIWKGCLLGRIDTYKISTYNGELLDFMKENFKRNLNISGLKLTLKNCTVLRKSKGSEQKSLPQVNFFSHLHSDFQFFTIHNSKLVFLFFFNCYLAAPRPTLGHYRGDSLTHPMLITAFFYIFDLKVTGSLVTRLGP